MQYGCHQSWSIHWTLCRSPTFRMEKQKTSVYKSSNGQHPQVHGKKQKLKTEGIWQHLKSCSGGKVTFPSLTSDYYIPLCKQARLANGLKYLLCKPDNLSSNLRTHEGRKGPTAKCCPLTPMHTLWYIETHTHTSNNNNNMNFNFR